MYNSVNKKSSPISENTQLCNNSPKLTTKSPSLSRQNINRKSTYRSSKMNVVHGNNSDNAEAFETVYESELRRNAINLGLSSKNSSHLNKPQSSSKSCLVYPSQYRPPISATGFYNGDVRRLDYLKEHLLKNSSSATSTASSSSLRSGTMGSSSSGVTGSTNDSFASNASSDIIITTCIISCSKPYWCKI